MFHLLYPSTGILIQDVDIPTDVEEPADLADGNVRQFIFC